MQPSINIAPMLGIWSPKGARTPGALSFRVLESPAVPTLSLDAARLCVASSCWVGSSRTVGASELPRVGGVARRGSRASSALGKVRPGCAFLRASVSKVRISSLRSATSWLIPADQTFLLTKFRCVLSGACAIFGGSRISASSRCALCH
eukprot:scaffold25644_cov62-Phaeocystis_antarctica.AAC.13